MRLPWRRKKDDAARRGPPRFDVESRRLLRDFLPPEGVPVRFEVAGLGARILAQVGDILITVAILIALMAVLFYSDLVSLTGLITVGSLLFFFIRAPYYTLCELLLNGQTLGKRLTGLKVIASDGRSLSAHSVTIRNLMKEVEVFVPGSMLLAADSLGTFAGLLLVIWLIVLVTVPLMNKKRQRLGDILAGTYVVLLPRPVLLRDLADNDTPQEAGFKFLQHQLDHYGRYELQTLETLLQVNSAKLTKPARDRHVENLKKVADTIAKRINFPEAISPDRAETFLLTFYRTQRAYLESRQLFGDARADKYHRDPDTEV